MLNMAVCCKLKPSQDDRQRVIEEERRHRRASCRRGKRRRKGGLIGGLGRINVENILVYQFVIIKLAEREGFEPSVRY